MQLFFVPDVAFASSVSESSGSEQSSVTRIVAVRFVVMLSVLTRIEDFAAFLTLQALLVPVSTQ